MKHSLVRHNQLFTLFLVSKKRASNKNEIVIDVQTVYEINDINKNCRNEIIWRMILGLWTQYTYSANSMLYPIQISRG